MFVVYKNKGMNLNYVTKFWYEDSKENNCFKITFVFTDSNNIEEFVFDNIRDVNYAYIKIITALEEGQKFLKF